MVQHFTAKAKCKELKEFTLWCYELCSFIHFCKNIRLLTSWCYIQVIRVLIAEYYTQVTSAAFIFSMYMPLCVCVCVCVCVSERERERGGRGRGEREGGRREQEVCLRFIIVLSVKIDSSCLLWGLLAFGLLKHWVCGWFHTFQGHGCRLCLEMLQDPAVWVSCIYVYNNEM